MGGRLGSPRTRARRMPKGHTGHVRKRRRAVRRMDLKRRIGGNRKTKDMIQIVKLGAALIKKN